MTASGPTSTPLYNFRLAPEAIWLIVNTVLGTLIVQLLADLANVNAVGDRKSVV